MITKNLVLNFSTKKQISDFMLNPAPLLIIGGAEGIGKNP